MGDILVRPAELRQISEQLKSSANKIGVALRVIDNDILALKGEKFLGNRANAVQEHYDPKRNALLKAQDIVARFAEDLQTIAGRFEQADKNGGSQPIRPPNPVIGPLPIGPIIRPPFPGKKLAPGDNLLKYPDDYLNQNDYPNVIMNNVTGETVGGVGCLATVIAMIARANGRDVTPVDVDNWIDAHGGYANNGSYMPQDAKAGFLNDALGKQGAMYDVNPANIKENIESGAPVVIHLKSTTNDGHYVLAVGVDSNGNYICADPLTGENRIVSAGEVQGTPQVYK